MKIKVTPEIERDVSLTTSFWEYNCSTKLVGVLSVKGCSPNDKYQSWYHQMMTDNKKPLIQEWLAKLDTKENFNYLDHNNNPAFPNHKTKYLPTVLVYSDVVAKAKHDIVDFWYSSFQGIVHALKTDPSYGVRVHSSPLFQNRTYERSPRPSRVWTLILKDSLIFRPDSGIKAAVAKVPQPFYDGLDEEEYKAALA